MQKNNLKRWRTKLNFYCNLWGEGFFASRWVTYRSSQVYFARAMVSKRDRSPQMSSFNCITTQRQTTHLFHPLHFVLKIFCLFANKYIHATPLLTERMYLLSNSYICLSVGKKIYTCSLTYELYYKEEVIFVILLTIT